jgi:hypothetical protein
MIDLVALDFNDEDDMMINLFRRYFHGEDDIVIDLGVLHFDVRTTC